MLSAVRASVHRLLFAATVLDVEIFYVDIFNFSTCGDCLLDTGPREMVEIAADSDSATSVMVSMDRVIDSS